MEILTITNNELKELRKKQWLKQDKKCAVLCTVIDFEDTTLDHKHAKAKEVLGNNGAGLCRGVLDFRVNSFEGRVLSIYKRSGLQKIIPLPKLLINLAAFLVNPPMTEKILHPTERRYEKIGKRDFNKLKKWYTELYPKRKELKYPCRGKIGKVLKKLLLEYRGK